jgi:hypothetical protein
MSKPVSQRSDKIKVMSGFWSKKVERIRNKDFGGKITKRASQIEQQASVVRI